MATRTIFCARCQAETEHEVSVDTNGEIVLTCTYPYTVEGSDEQTPCGRFVKFPAGMTVDAIVASLAVHKEANAGQVSVEASEAIAEALADVPPGE